MFVYLFSISKTSQFYFLFVLKIKDPHLHWLHEINDFPHNNRNFIGFFLLYARKTVMFFQSLWIFFMWNLQRCHPPSPYSTHCAKYWCGKDLDLHSAATRRWQAACRDTVTQLLIITTRRRRRRSLLFSSKRSVVEQKRRAPFSIFARDVWRPMGVVSELNGATWHLSAAATNGRLRGNRAPVAKRRLSTVVQPPPHTSVPVLQAHSHER